MFRSSGKAVDVAVRTSAGSLGRLSSSVKISASEARRIALASQGFADPRPSGEPTGQDLRRVLGRIGLIQIDSVNVLERAHYLPLFSRLGPVPARPPRPRRALRAAPPFRVLGPRGLADPRGDAAPSCAGGWSGLTRTRGAGCSGSSASSPSWSPRSSPKCAERGPVAASDLAERPRRAGPWWDWSDHKRALEWLFWSGQISSARRRRFERLYDVTERVLPRDGRRALRRPPSRTRSATCSASRRTAWESRPKRTSATTSASRPTRRSCAWPSWSRPESSTRSRSRAGAERPGYLWHGRRSRAGSRRAPWSGPFDPADLGEAAGRADLRLQLPARDLRPRAQARPRLLRPAFPPG